MRDLLASAISTLLPLAIPLSMFNLGLAAGRPHALRLLRHPTRLARFVLVTFVVMPAVSLLLVLLMPLPQPVVAGLLLMSLCPPGLGLSQKTLKLTGDSEAGLAWQAFAIPLSVVTIPISLMLMQATLGVGYLPGASAVLWKVVTIFLVPVAIGLAVGMLWPAGSPALLTRLKPLATLGQLTLLVLALVASGAAIASMGLASIAVVVAMIGLAIVLGHAMGGPDESSRPILASTLALRWPAPALALAEVNQSSAEITPVVLTFVLAGALLMIPYGRWLARRRPGADPAPAGASQ
jgi:BASS family bile acid:Na+ symporter